MNVAIFSPNQNPYSETFIQAHKKLLKDNVKFYFGPTHNIKLEGSEEEFKIYRRFLVFFERLGLIKKNNSWVFPLIWSLRKHNVQSVLVEYGNHSHKLLPVLMKLKIPVVPIFHGFDASVYKVIEECENYQDVFRVSHRVICVSKKMKNTLVGLGCSAEKIVYTPCGPNDMFFTLQPDFTKDQFVSIGRFVDKKAPYFSILAFHIVLKKYPKYVLKMGGDGPLLNTCKNLVKHLGIQNNVKFLGVISPEELKNELIISKGFIQHSITAENGDQEGTPVAVMEANAAGIPVISTYHAGIPDVIIHDQTGLLSEEKDVEDMAQNIIKIIENKDLAIQMGKRGRQRIEENFNMRIHISKIQATLDNPC